MGMCVGACEHVLVFVVSGACVGVFIRVRLCVWAGDRLQVGRCKGVHAFMCEWAGDCVCVHVHVRVRVHLSVYVCMLLCLCEWVGE